MGKKAKHPYPFAIYVWLTHSLTYLLTFLGHCQPQKNHKQNKHPMEISI